MITLKKGDCLELMKDIPDESVDLIVTDPPYKVTSRGNAGNSGGMLQSKLSMEGKIFRHNAVDISQYSKEFYRVLKEGTHCYVMCNHKNLVEMLNKFIEVGFIFTKSLIWNKSNKIMGQFYMSQFEYILFFRKGRAKKINFCGTADILNFPNKKTKDATGKNIHDTEKPVGLMEQLIVNSSTEGDTVLDPFMGSGSTGVACVNTGRNFIGMELDQEYFEIAKERIEGALK